MRLFFRTFTGYETKKSVFMYTGKRDEESPEWPGTEIIYSREVNFNRHCLKCGDRYQEKALYKTERWKDLFFKSAEFARDYPEIGMVTFWDSEIDETSILTEKANFNAYQGIDGVKSFYVLFNARPSETFYNEGTVLIGYDRYSLAYEPGSIIVWNFDKYLPLDCGDYTIWGVRQNTGKHTSRTDDVLVGVKKEKLLFAISD